MLESLEDLSLLIRRMLFPFNDLFVDLLKLNFVIVLVGIIVLLIRHQIFHLLFKDHLLLSVEGAHLLLQVINFIFKALKNVVLQLLLGLLLA